MPPKQLPKDLDEMTDEDWQEILTDEQYTVTRQDGTEPSFTGRYHDHKGDGVYRCVCCGAALFDSDAKFSSGSGWPSFYQPLDDAPIEEREDRSHGMVRTEARCQACDAHLGHIFDDGPAPTGLRYCINSAALDFEER